MYCSFSLHSTFIIIVTHHVLSHGQSFLFSLGIKLALDQIKLFLGKVACISDLSHLILVFLQILPVRYYLILICLSSLWKCLELYEGCISINWLALPCLLLLESQLLNFSLRIVLIFLILWPWLIIICLHLIDLLLALLADLNFIDGSGEARGDSEAELSDFLKFSNSIVHKHGLSAFHVLLVAARLALSIEYFSLAFHNVLGVHLKLSVDVPHLSKEFLDLPQ